MKRLLAALILLSSLAVAPIQVSAQEQTLEQQIVAQLNEQGYSEVSVGRTLLGRLRILAYSDGFRREIVLNPSTGEILRDYLVAIADNGNSDATIPRLVLPGGSGSSGSGGSSSHGGGDDDDDDDDDDHSEQEN